mmetsp:Transcript_35640/g.53119  ORF Transcript_35640/g.53119 Transcript_35640/m.53119 type:complete len:91 (+) Transcript_35640:219-491(+)
MQESTLSISSRTLQQHPIGTTTTDNQNFSFLVFWRNPTTTINQQQHFIDALISFMSVIICFDSCMHYFACYMPPPIYSIILETMKLNLGI